MEWGLNRHSVTQEVDYVSPIAARSSALQLELACNLHNHGPWVDQLWHDARVDELDNDDLTTCCPSGDLAERFPLHGTGATGHMDSLPGIEPCHDVWAAKLETAIVAACRLDLCEMVGISHEPVHSALDCHVQRQYQGHPFLTSCISACPFSVFCRQAEDTCELRLTTPRTLVKGGSCRSFPDVAPVAGSYCPRLAFSTDNQGDLFREQIRCNASTAQLPVTPSPRGILVKGGSCRPFPQCDTGSRHISHRKPCRVRFSHEVAFWFPSPTQLQLAQSSPPGADTGIQLQLPGKLVLGRRKPKAPTVVTVPPQQGSDALPFETAGYRLQDNALRNAAFTQVASCSSDPSGFCSSPFSSFDSVSGHRVLQGQSDWPDWRFVIHAIKESVFPGNPLGRFMHHNVVGFPTPQVMITPARRFEAVGSVVFDLRGLSLGIEVVDITPGVSIAAVLPSVKRFPSFPAVLSALRKHTLRCTVNDKPATAETTLAAEAEVIIISGSIDASATLDDDPRPGPLTAASASSSASVSFSERPQRPPTPPIPARPVQVIRRWGQARRVTSAMETAMRRQDEADDSAPICTIFDPLRQFQFSQTPTCHRPSAFLAFAMSKATHLGDCLDGRILSYPLPGVPTPQACVHSIVHAGYIVIPVALGDGSFCTLSIHKSSSVVQLFEQLESRCGVPRSYRFLLQRGWIVCFINHRAVSDVTAADALMFADSAHLMRTPTLVARESPARLEDAVSLRPLDSQSVFVHRPGAVPIPISTVPLPYRGGGLLYGSPPSGHERRPQDD